MPDFVDMGTSDFLVKSSALRRHGLTREFFNPTNPVHIASMKHYMETGSYTVQFYPEDPFIDVPMTMFRKYAGHHLNLRVTTAQKRDAKLHAGADAHPQEPTN